MPTPRRRGARSTRRAGLAVLLVLATTIAAAQSPERPSEPGGAIAVTGEPRSDAAMAERLRAIYRQLDGFQDIVVEVTSGVVTLGGEAPDAVTREEAERLAGRVEGVVTLRNRIRLETSVEESLRPALERLTARLQDALGRLPLIALAALVLLLFVLAGIGLARLRRPWDRLAPNAFVADLLRQVVRLAFAASGVVVALDLIGATALLGTILGAAGIIGLAVGFAVRDTIENYVASILLSIRQPFRPNDHVLIEGHEGHVIRLTSRATVLMTLDGNHVRISNASVFKGVIVNFTRNSERRFDFQLGVDAAANLKQAIEIGLDTLRGLAFVLSDPEPLGWIEEVGDSNVVLWFGGWIDQRETDFAKARSEAIRLTKRALEEAGIALPEPGYRLRLESAATERPETAPRTAAPMAGSAESPSVGDASREDAVPDKVAAERAQETGRDLLDSNAPPE